MGPSPGHIGKLTANKLKLAQRVIDLRQEQNLSSEEMAEGDYGVSLQELEAVEGGRHQCDIEILVRLSYKLGVKIQDLLR